MWEGLVFVPTIWLYRTRPRALEVCGIDHYGIAFEFVIVLRVGATMGEPHSVLHKAVLSPVITINIQRTS